MTDDTPEPDLQRIVEAMMPDENTSVTVDSIRQQVHRIFEMTSDPEAAHIAEDDLWAEVLKAIAADAPNAAELANEALETLKIDFTHWYA